MSMLLVVNAISCPRVLQVSPDLSDPSTWIKRKTLAEKMDLCDLLDEEEETDGSTYDEVCLVEVWPRMEQHLARSFALMTNMER